MKNLMRCLTMVAILLMETSLLPAQEVEPKVTPEENYKNFRYTVPPKEALLYVQRAALWLSEQG